MNRKTVWVAAGSILVGLVLGLAIRRARVPSALSEALRPPPRAGVATALLRAEIQDLDARLGALREESARIEREKARLAALSQPPAPLSPEETLRQEVRAALQRDYNHNVLSKQVQEWIRQDPANVGKMMHLAADILREKPRSREEIEKVGAFLSAYLTPALLLDGRAQLDRIAAYLIEAQQSEPDLLVRCWMLSALDVWEIKLPDEMRAGLAKTFRETSDAEVRRVLLGHLMRDPASRELVAEAIRQEPDPRERTYQLLKAWDRRALPVSELRSQVKDIMKSDQPGWLIQESQDWVPKFINPLAPQETVALFNQTLSRPIDPVHKAVSLMVMGSIATLFPGHPGRAEIEKFVEATDDPRFKEFGGKVGSLVDEGKGFNEIRQLNPLKFGFEIPKEHLGK